MWSIIKWLFIIAIIGGGVLWFTDVKISGKTVKEHAGPVLESPIVKEGVRDLRQIVGEGLKAAGEAISEDVTDSERKQLDDLVKQELMKGRPIPGAPGQVALPPAQHAVPQAAQTAPRPGANEMLQRVSPAAPTAAAPVPPAGKAEPTEEQPRMIPAPTPVPQATAPMPPQGGDGY